MKKILGLLLSAALILFASCGSGKKEKSYKAYFNEGQQYEKKGNWVYALDSYWNALLVCGGLEGDEALERFNMISDAIKSGKPGLDINMDNKFAVYDGWVEIKKNFEKLFTEKSIITVYLKDIEKGTLDYKTKSQKYNISVELRFTDEYVTLQNMMISGHKKACAKEDWEDNNEELYLWPSVSVHNGNGSGLIPDGSALLVGGLGSRKSDTPAFMVGLYEIVFDIVDVKRKPVVSNLAIDVVAPYSSYGIESEMTCEIKNFMLSSKEVDDFTKTLEDYEATNVEVDGKRYLPFKLRKINLRYGEVVVDSDELEMIADDDLSSMTKKIESLKRTECKLQSNSRDAIKYYDEKCKKAQEENFVAKYGKNPLYSGTRCFKKDNAYIRLLNENRELYNPYAENSYESEKKYNGYFVQLNDKGELVTGKLLYIYANSVNYESAVYDLSVSDIMSSSYTSYPSSYMCEEKKFYYDQNLYSECEPIDFGVSVLENYVLEKYKDDLNKKHIKEEKERLAKEEAARKNAITTTIWTDDGSKVNVRSSPRTGNIVGQFEYGTKVSLLAGSNDYDYIEGMYDSWIKVTDGKITGWIFGGFTTGF